MLGFRMMKKRMFERVRSKKTSFSAVSLNISEDPLLVARALVTSELSNIRHFRMHKGAHLHPGRTEISRIKNTIIELIGKIEGRSSISSTHLTVVKHIIKDGTQAIRQEARRIALSCNGRIDDEQLRSLSEIIIAVKNLKAFYQSVSNRCVRKGC